MTRPIGVHDATQRLRRMAAGVSSIIARNTIKLRPASISVAGETLCILLLVERFKNYSE